MKWSIRITSYNLAFAPQEYFIILLSGFGDFFVIVRVILGFQMRRCTADTNLHLAPSRYLLLVVVHKDETTAPKSKYQPLQSI